MGMELEKVIKAMECCIITPGFCRDDCPYRGKGDENDYCDEKLFKDALALLKAQVPRLLTLDDYMDNPDVDKQGRLPCWVEYKDDEYCGWSFVSDWELADAKEKRYWTSRPTDEQREATPWQS